ncbi:MmcQ/YjbR family DNA-binding protein [Acinetobacter wuhouensis]|uniref:MmcQ/YjbR family DNA-binding protein n=1 Tax=Acinetobacter wuhouensis TaxID=1879050 RepID=A0A3G2T7S9_9GAMM|nr:MmcQ/YjbR family DNA-binding protein [Acinetobacter wuhouensis]AYO55567.1 MmcQ/YjbR family DNA-binding protein [Acinetobacter wuhouensis]
MTGNDIQAFALKIAAQLPKAELDYPFGEDIHVYKIMGKVFMLVFDLNGKEMVNLKVQPEHGEMLRDVYESIHTGYHMNKRHWISIYEGEQITEELIEDLVQNSYTLVVKTLTKAQKQVLAIHSQV